MSNVRNTVIVKINGVERELCSMKKMETINSIKEIGAQKSAFLEGLPEAAAESSAVQKVLADYDNLINKLVEHLDDAE